MRFHTRIIKLVNPITIGFAFTLVTSVVAIGVAANSGKQALQAPDDVATQPSDSETTASDLASKVLRVGNGNAHPDQTSNITVHYTDWTTDGQMFDSSVARGEPATFPLNRVIRGWTEGLQLMVVGEKRRFWIPADLAYGANPRPGAPQWMLVFDVELLKIGFL